MTLEDLGNIGDFLGSIAVLITLAYLAVQVRQSKNLLEENRKISLSQVYATRAMNRISDIRQDIDSPYSAKIAAEINGISEDEMRVRLFHQRHIVHHDNLLYQNELGLLAESDVARVTAIIVAEYPSWKSSGANVLMRVEEWYESHRNA